MAQGPTTLELIYTVVDDIVNPLRIGTQQTMQINADTVIVKRVRDSSQQFSRRGLRVATTVHGIWLTGEINEPYLTGDKRLQYSEFYRSVINGETFSIAFPAGYFGIDPDEMTIQAIVQGDEFGAERIGPIDRYSAGLSWRQVSG